MSTLRTPQANSSSFDPAPAGWHIARCYAIVDLGTHYDQKWEKDTHMVRIGFELPKSLRDDGKPFVIFKRYTFSHHEKAVLRKDLEAWYGKKFSTTELNKTGGFDLAKIVGRTAFVNITHNDAADGNTYANISAIGPLPPEMSCPEPENEPIFFSLQAFNQAVFDSLTERTREQIQGSREWAQMNAAKAPAKQPAAAKPAAKPAPATGKGPVAANFDDMDEDIPF